MNSSDTQKPCECDCHTEEIYPKEKNGHCWVCNSGAIIKDTGNLSGTQKPEAKEQI